MKKLLILATVFISFTTNADTVKAFKSLSPHMYQLSDIPVLFPEHRLINIEDIVELINEVGQLERVIYTEDVYKERGLSLSHFYSGNTGYSEGEPMDTYPIINRLGGDMDYFESIISAPILHNGEYFYLYISHRFSPHQRFEDLSIVESQGPDLSSIYSKIIIVEKDSVQEIPLPAAAWLFGSALLGLGAFAKRK